LFRESLAIRERLAMTDPSNARWQRDLKVAYTNVGELLQAQHEFASAVEAYRAILALAERLAASHPGDTTRRHKLAIAHFPLAHVLLQQGDLAGAVQVMRAGILITERLAPTDFNKAELRAIATAYFHVGDSLLTQGNGFEPLELYQKGLAALERAVALDGNDIDQLNWLWDISIKVGAAQMLLGRHDDALVNYRKALAITEVFVTNVKACETWPASERALTFAKIAEVLVAQQDLSGALQAYREFLVLQEQLAKANPTDDQMQETLRGLVAEIGGMAYRLVLAGEFSRALDAADLAIGYAAGELWIHNNRAHALMLLGRDSEARMLYLQYRGQKKAQGDMSWEAIVLEDFAELRQAGLQHPLMKEIEELFRAAG
jgi:tetratricopeptide (TPR) repeat protein